jgi:hypothetical protein
MKPTLTILIAALFYGLAATAQPVLAPGFSGSAAINGSLLTRTGTVPLNGSFVTASSDGFRFYMVATSGAPRIYFIDAGSFAVTDSMAMPVLVADIAATSVPDRLYAVSGRALYRINTATKAVVDSVLLNNTPDNFARIEERPGSSEVWVGRDSTVYVVNWAGTPSVTSFNVPSARGASIIKFTPGGSTAYVQYQATRQVVRVNAATKTAGVSLQRSGSIGWPEITADSSRLWLLDINNPRIILYDAATLAAVDSIVPIQPALNTLYRHPTRNEIWGIGHFPDTLTVFNASTKAVLAYIRLESDPFYLAFGNMTSGIAAGPGNSHLYEVAIYPNPAHDVLTVQLPEGSNAKLVIHDGTGRTVLTATGSGGWAKIPVARLRAGSYWLTVYESGKMMRSLPWVKGE